MNKIKHYRELCEKATPGPWKPSVSYFSGINDSEGEPVAETFCKADRSRNDGGFINTQFIAESREALPWALDRLEEAERIIKIIMKFDHAGKMNMPWQVKNKIYDFFKNMST